MRKGDELPWMFLHGALGRGKDFSRLIDGTEWHGVFCPDFPGHGKSSPRTPFTIESMVDFVSKELDKLGWQEVALFGYSMGGYVALRLASRRDKRVKHVATLGTKLAWTQDFARKQTRYLDASKILNKVPEFAKHLEEIHGSDWDQVLTHTAQMMHDLVHNSRMQEANWQKIEVPVCLGRGEHDHMVSREECTVIAHGYHNVSYIELKDVAHPIEKVPKTAFADYLNGMS